ncbi:MAG: relaxase/mobilization nuclease domain-containing protein [bacterium]|nr:relaxase/mobilization nuclease domain-containing protein [Gammaproteobacteria bacterium]MCP4051206.1 relaxase/mobilization nuclease domain-containing protein [bacterium]
MIGKAKSISHGGKTIDYALKREDGYVLDKNYVIGDTGKEIKSEFSLVYDKGSKVQNREISFVLSPEPSDGANLSDEKLREISQEFMSNMGLSEHQYVAVVHEDKAHKHLHIVANRVNLEGNCYNDRFIGKKAQMQADLVAQSHGLIRAREIERMKKEQLKSLKKELRNVFKAVLSKKPQSFEEYTQLMAKDSVKVLPSVNKQGKMQGYRLEFKGENLKASSVSKNLTLGKLKPVFKASREIANEITIKKSKGYSPSL